MTKVIYMFFLLIGSATVAMAFSVPEVDPTSGVSAIALLSGALLIFRARRK